MTYLVYLDEQEGEIDGEAYTAVIGFRICARDIIKVRALFYPLYNEVLDREIRGPERSEAKHVQPMPVLHGCDFLRDFSDTVKFEVLDILIRSLEGIDCDFLRIGYFNGYSTNEPPKFDRKAKIDLATTGVGFAIMDKPDDDHILVSEFDKEALRKSLDTAYSNLSTNFVIGPNDTSYNLMHLIGHYRATKSELGCQIADVINYCCLKSSNPKGEFASRLSQYYKVVADRYLVNQIIWWNDENKTHYFPQKNPD